MNVVSILGLVKAIGALIEEILTLSTQSEMNDDEKEKAIEEVKTAEVKLKNLEQRIMKTITK